MRPNHALAIARHRSRKDFTTIAVVFTSDDRFLRERNRYTYKVLRSARVKAGDNVVVQIPSGAYRVGVVSEVHKTPQITGQEPYDFKWIVQKVDPSTHTRLTNLDTEFKEYIANRDTERLLRESLDFLKKQGRGRK